MLPIISTFALPQTHGSVRPSQAGNNNERNTAMTIDFTQEECTALIQLIDLAVKSGGLNVAQAGVHLAEKIHKASQPEPITDNE